MEEPRNKNIALEINLSSHSYNSFPFAAVVCLFVSLFLRFRFQKNAFIIQRQIPAYQPELEHT